MLYRKGHRPWSFGNLGRLAAILVSGCMMELQGGGKLEASSLGDVQIVAATTCTLCDDPADEGNVAWCDATTCIAGAAPNNNSGQNGYCPALYERIQEEGYSNCGNVTLTSTSTSSFCDGGNRVYMGHDVDCAYTIHAEATNRGEITERWSSGAGPDGVGFPTSMAYKVPGSGDLWYQFFEKGVIVNDEDGTEAYLIGADSTAGASLKALYKSALEDGRIHSEKLYPAGDAVWEPSHSTLFVLFTASGTPPKQSGMFSRDSSVFEVTSDLFPKYADYNGFVTNPDLFRAHLGLPISAEQREQGAEWKSQAFENGVIWYQKDGNHLVSGGSKAKACIHCDDNADGRSNAFCINTCSDSTCCASTGGCSWDSDSTTCRGSSNDWCSPNPGGTLCQTRTIQSACQAAMCDWIPRACYNPVTIGAIAERIDQRAWSNTACGDVTVDSDTGEYSQECAIDGDTHKVVWSPNTECAYVLNGGSDTRSKIKTKYETAFPGWGVFTSVFFGEIRKNTSKLYLAVQGGASSMSGPGPVGTDPSIDIVDNTVRWRFLAAGTTHGDLLGAPTSEATELGTGSWYQHFEYGTLVIKAGDSQAHRIGDHSEEGLNIKHAWMQDEASVISNNLFPRSDMRLLRSHTRFVSTGTSTDPSGYFGTAGGGFYLGPDALDEYAGHDSAVLDPDYDSGWLGKPVVGESDGDSTGTWTYAAFEAGIITDYGGPWSVYGTAAPAYEYQEIAGDDPKIHCLDPSHHDLAMEMARLGAGWGNWTGPKSSYTDNGPIDGDRLGGYYRPVGTDKIVVYNYWALGNSGSAQCAFALEGKIKDKWDSFDKYQRQRYGYPTTPIVNITDGSDSYEFVALTNGIIGHVTGSTGSALVLGTNDLHFLHGRALKNLWLEKYKQGEILSGGYRLLNDSTSTSTPDGWRHMMTKPGGGTHRYFFVKDYSGCTGKNMLSCQAAAHCAWGRHNGTNACINRAYEVSDDIRRHYYDYDTPTNPDYEQGYLGFPTSEQECGDATCSWWYQNFEGGHISSDGTSRYDGTDDILPCLKGCEGLPVGGCNTSTCYYEANATDSCAFYGACEPCSANYCGVSPTGSRAGRCEWLLCLDASTLRTCPQWHANTNNDADMDGMDDDFEKSLAEHFRPRMLFSLEKDIDVFYGEGSICPDSDPQCQQPYIVREYDRSWTDFDCSMEPYQCLEIVYTLLYAVDFGDNFLLRRNVGEHIADGELYAILVARKDPGPDDLFDTPWADANDRPVTSESGWYIAREFHAAHMCPPFKGESSHFTDRSSLSLARRNDRRNVWVAEKKHASYRSDGRCDGDGFANMDNCKFYKNLRVATSNMVNVGEHRCHSLMDSTVAMPPKSLPTAECQMYMAQTGNEFCYSSLDQAGGKYGTYDVWSGLLFGYNPDRVGALLPKLEPGVLSWANLIFTCN